MEHLAPLLLMLVHRPFKVIPWGHSWVDSVVWVVVLQVLELLG
jgi:hypothetical protein